MTKLDLDFVRSQFPAYTEPSLQGWAHFENAGGSYTCGQVLDRLNEFYRQTKVQPYHAHPVAQRGGEAMDESYNKLAEYLNVSSEDVHLGPSSSQNSYVLAQAFEQMLEVGDEIIVTDQDHEANSGVWRKLGEQGLTVKEWKVDPESGQLDPDMLQRLLSDRTRLVAYPHCSNIVAHWNPVREINDMIHAAGALAIVDGVAAAPHGLPDLAALDADVYLISLYKTWGPHLGLMTVKDSLLDQLANQGHYFHEGMTRKLLLPAGPDHAQIAAAAGVIDYLEALYDHHFSEAADIQGRRSAVQTLITNQENDLLEQLLDWLRGRDDLCIVGPDHHDQRAPTVSILPLRKDITSVQTKLTEQKLMTGVAHFYTVRLLDAMQIPMDPGVLRMSFLHTATQEELDQLINGLSAALD